jgi:hypothetical protein
MRYLIVIGLLALSCSAFAAGGPPPQDDSAAVVMDIAKWVDVDISEGTLDDWDPGEVAATFAGNVDEVSAVTIKTNCTWTAAVSAQTVLTGATDSIAAAGAAIAPAAGGATGAAGIPAVLTVNYLRSGLDDNADHYVGSVTVTVSG